MPSPLRAATRPHQRRGHPVTLENTGKSLAFFVHVTVEAAGRDVAPVIWEDNYVSLMPGEKRTVTATVHRKDLRGAPAEIKLDGWNVN